jgi:hypothetical protein
MKRKGALILLFIALSAFLIEANAQQPVVYLDAGFQRIKESIATYKVPLKANGDGTYSGELTFNGIVKMTGQYIPFKTGFIENGVFTFFHPNGKMESTGAYERGARIGVWKRFDADGKPKPDRFYSPEGAENVRIAMGISTASDSKE